MVTMRRTLVGVGVVLATVFAAAQQGAPGGEWTRYGGDPGSTKYAPLDQINKRQRHAAARSRGGGPAVDPSISSRAPNFSYSNNFRATPLMIGGVLYSPNGIGLVEAFHPGTGKTIVGPAAVSRRSRAGVARRQRARPRVLGDGSDRRLFVDPRRIL